MKGTLLVVPPNDPEAVMILELAKKLGLDTIVSRQPHGASLEKEVGLIGKLETGNWKQVVIVEMPGPSVEKKIRASGIQLHIIDHHHYTNLDRAHDPKTHKLLPSSLEQFRKLFSITDAKLRAWKFDPKLVSGIGIMDRGFVWGLFDAGYSRRDVERVMEFQAVLMKPYIDPSRERAKEKLAERAWQERKKWEGYWVIVDRSDAELRPRISRIIAKKVGRPIPLILVEKKRGLIYVQESPHAMKLFNAFGGFTFGMDRNWGYKNEKGRPMVTLQDVKRLLASLR